MAEEIITIYNLQNKTEPKGKNGKGGKIMKNYPKYVKTVDGYIGVFKYLDFGEFPVYRFEGGERVADDWEIANGSDNIDHLNGILI